MLRAGANFYKLCFNVPPLRYANCKILQSEERQIHYIVALMSYFYTTSNQTNEHRRIHGSGQTLLET